MMSNESLKVVVHFSQAVPASAQDTGGAPGGGPGGPGGPGGGGTCTGQHTMKSFFGKDSLNLELLVMEEILNNHQGCTTPSKKRAG